MRVSGASGALPAWIGTAQGLASAGLLASGGTLPEELRFPAPEGMGRVTVEAGSGLPVDDPEEERSILAPLATGEHARRFVPVRPPRDVPWSEQASWNQPLVPEVDGGLEGGEPIEGGEFPTEPGGGSVWDAIE
jgi:hypothetical protein